MKIAIVVDGTRPRELAHARAQARRLRRAGFGVVGPSSRPGRRDRDSVVALYAVGAGVWRSARRLARRSGAPLLYDHPPGTTPPARLRKADAVIASGRVDATELARGLGGCASPVVVPPDPPRRGERPRPRLRRRLGVDGRAIALQERADLSIGRARALVGTVSSLPDIDLVFLGGRRWDAQAGLTELAGELQAADRVHFLGEIPSARRVEYMAEADIGLALAAGGPRSGQLAAADVFDMLGIPFVVASGEPDRHPGGCIVSGEEPAALQAAILEAGERRRVPARNDGAQILKEILLDVVVPDGGRSGSTGVHKPPGRSKGTRASEPDVEAVAAALLDRAKALADRGESEQAVALYGEIVADSHPPQAMAAAAAALARLGARAEAWAAIDRVLGIGQRSALATVRLAEAAALLGDLTRARELVDEVSAGPDTPAPALRAAVRVLEQAGEPRVALRVARRLGDAPSNARIEGTLESYDPTWLPAGSGVSAPPPLAGRALCLLETSLPHVRSGYTYRAQTLLRAQRRAGIEPTVLTRLGFPATRGLSAPPVEQVDGIDHHRAGLHGVNSYTSVPVSEQLEENVRWAANLGRELRPEVIVAATPHLNGLVGLSLRNELGVPLVYDVRGFPEMTWAVRNGGDETDAFGLRRIAETRCMREADLVTTLSETMRRQIVGRGVPPERVFVLPHAVDTKTFAPRGRDEELAARLGVAGRPIVGYISSLVAYEGVETLLDAIALARREDPSIAGLIVGSGDLQRSLEARATQRGLGGDVVFTGRVDADEISRYYSLADIFVCPRHDHEVTRYVTPLKPFEAMAAGCCVAVSDLPTLREAVRDGECGALFPAGDAEGLAATVLDLLDRPQRRRELQAAARDHAVANHGFDTLCTQLEEAWAQVRFAR